MGKQYFFVFILFFSHIYGLNAQHAHDEKPKITLAEREALLKIDEFLPDKGRIALNYGMNYSSYDRSGYLTEFFPIAIDENSVFFVPSMRSTSDRTDVAALNLGIRYNTGTRFNLSAHMSGGYRYERFSLESGKTHNSGEIDFHQLTIGTDFKAFSFKDRGVINGFISVGALEKNKSRLIYGKSFSAGLTGYWTVDPVILSTTISYNGFFKHNAEQKTQKSGNVLSIVPTVGFAVNPDMNLSWGMGFAFKQGDEASTIKESSWKMLSTIHLGLGYRIDEDKLLNISGSSGVAGNHATQFGVSMTQRF